MLLLTLLAATAAATAGEKDGKIMAADDWSRLSIYGVAPATRGEPLYLQVHAGDLDGDGKPDDAVLKLVCTDGQVRSAHYQLASPRDAATGQASGKRTHHPVKFVKEWGPASPQLRAMTTSYDLKKIEGARVGADGWSPVSLVGTDGLCAAADAAAATIVKAKSNITNN